MRRKWKSSEVATLRRLYPDTITSVVARKLGKSIYQVYNKANVLGLKKSAAFNASDASGRLSKMTKAGVAHRFTKGQKAWNQGVTGYMGANRTSFKNGERPHTWRPIGSERVTEDGYLQRKLTDTGYPPRDWKNVQQINWEAVNGPLPKGHILVSRDRNSLNVVASNWECITRAENMRRNTLHRYPKEIARLIQLRGALNRQINKREGKHE